MGLTEDFWKAMEEEERRKKEKKKNQSLLDEDDIAPINEMITPINNGGFPSTTVLGGATPKPEDPEDDDFLFGFFQQGSFKDGFDWMDVPSSILGTAGDIAYNVVKAPMQIGEGIGDLLSYGIASGYEMFGDEQTAEGIRRETKKNLVEEWTGGVGDYLDQYSLIGETGKSVAQGVGQLGTMAATAYLGGAAGLGAGGITALTSGMMGLSSMGSGMTEAYQSGATDEEALAYGAIAGAADALSEMLFGGLGKGVNALGFNRGLLSADDLLAKKLSQNIQSHLGKTLVQYGIKSGAEGLEEVIAGVAQAWGKKLTYMSEEDIGKILEDEKLLEQFVVGAVTSAIGQGSTMIQSVKTGSDFVTNYNQDEQTVVDRVIEETIAEREKKNGKALSHAEKTEIQQEIQRNLDNGFISADKIEEILGGESYEKFKAEKDGFYNSDAYKAYKETSKKEQAEIKDLEKRLKKLEGAENTVGNNRRYDALQNRLDALKNNSKASQMKAQLDTEAKRIGGIRNQLRTEVMTRVKGTRLQESYNELIRSTQKFQVDLNQYKNENARKTVESIIKSGLGDNSKKFHHTVDFLAKLSADKGLAFDLTNNERIEGTEHHHKGYITNGYVTDDGVVTLNMDSPKALNTTVGHEVTHVLEQAGVYQELQNAVRDYAIAREGLKGYNARIKAAEEAYKGKKNTTAEGEVTADLIGEYIFTDYDFVHNLSTKNRNVFQRIYDEIKYMVKVATAGSQEAKALLKAKKMFDKAYRENVKGQEDSSPEAKQAAADEVQYSIVKDQETIDWLEDQDYLVVYKAMSLHDGKLYPPMASQEYVEEEYTTKKGEKKTRRVRKLKNPSILGKWQQADERPDLIKNFKPPSAKYPDGYGTFDLLKSNGKTTGDVAYNPYEHTSNIVLNDQFAEAYQRPELVTVEYHIPKSELTSGYKAQYAKDPVGLTDWKTGIVATKLTKNRREVYLTRWSKPVRIVPDSEVAQKYKELLDQEDGITVPWNVVTTSLRTELEKLGVPIDYSDVASGTVIKNFETEMAKQGVQSLEGGSVTKYSLSTWTPDTQDRVRGDLVKAGFDQNDVDKWIEDTNGIAAVIASDKARLDFEAADNQVMLKDNQEYIKTLDASTLCAKRLVYQGTFDAIQHRLPNTMLSSDDLIELLNMMKAHGVQTPCGVCYVESRRRHLGKFAQQWLDGYDGEYKPRLDELTTSDGLEALRKSHPDAYKAFTDAMNKKGSSNPKVVQLRTEYRNDIMSLTPAQIRKIEAIGGLRVQSFSDFETPHLLDMMQAVMDMSAKGLHSQAYTKVPNFAWVFGNTGIKINLSLIAEGDGFDSDGNLAFSSVEGMDINEAMKLRDAYSENVGTIIVGANDKHILACMADDRIDYIIPFHRSGWGANELKMMGMTSYTDYTYGQKEHDLNKPTKVVNGVQQYAGLENLYPPDYWDYNLSGKENAERYLNLCAKTGREPKFAQFLVNNGDGTYSLQPDGSTDGYWKTLIDFKMYDNDGKGAAQQKVVPNFNMEEAHRVLNEYEGGANKLPVANEVVEEFVKKHQYSLTKDSDGKDLTAEQQEFFKDSKLRDEDGRLIPMYHGTNSPNFTVFDPQYSDDKTSLFFTSDPEVANTYTMAQDYGRDVDPYNLITKDSSAEQFNKAQERVGGGLRVVKVTKDWIAEMKAKAESAKQNYINEVSEIADEIEEASRGDVAPFFDVYLNGVREALASGKVWGSDLGYSLNRLQSSLTYLKNRKLERSLSNKLYDVKKTLDTVRAYEDSVVGEEYVGQYVYTETNSLVPFVARGKTDSYFTHIIPGTESELVEKALDRMKWVKEHNLGNRYKVYLNLTNPYILDTGTDYSGVMERVSLEHSNGGWTVEMETAEDDITKYMNADEFNTFVESAFDAETAATIKAQIEADNEAYRKKWDDLDPEYVDHDIQLENVNVSYIEPGKWSSLKFNGSDTAKTRDVAAWAKANGYDGVIFKNMKDSGGYAAYRGRGASTVAVAFDSNKVKSVENAKPTADPDIRYSLTKAEEIENAYQYDLENEDMLGAEMAVEEMANIMMPDSKIRGKDGRLIPVYHGTNAQFWEFDTSADGGKNGTAEGFGIYLSDDTEVTEIYGDRQIKMFANITKPATSFKKTITASTLKKLIKQTCERQAQMMVEEDGYDSIKDALRDTWISNYVMTYGMSMEQAYREVANEFLKQNDNDKDLIHEVMFGMAIRSYDQAMDFYRNSLTPVTGIDGFVTKWTNSSTGKTSNIYLAFDSSQLKSADAVTRDENGNVIPLKERFNPEKKDIRYSVGDDHPIVGNWHIYGNEFGDRDPLSEFDVAPVGGMETTENSSAVGVNAPVDERLASLTDADAPPEVDNTPPRDIETVQDRVRQMIENAQTELDRNIQLRQDAYQDYAERIKQAEAELDAKKNKNTKAAEIIKQRIARLKRLQADSEATYAKRINDLEKRVEKYRSKEYNRAEVRRSVNDKLTQFWSDLIGDTSTWKDLPLGLAYKTKTLRRILRAVVKDGRGNPDIKVADDIYDALETKYDKHEAELKVESQRLKESFKAMDLTHEEDTYAQMLGELRHNPETELSQEVVEEYYNKNKKKIDTAKVDRAIAESRKLYDELFERVNKVLKAQGIKEIEYRKGYFPHFTKPKQGWFAKLLNWKTIDTEIPTSIAGLTQDFKPQKSWQSFAQKRRGDTTDYSLYQGLDTYIHGALDWIYHIEDLQSRRALENYIRFTHSDEGIQQRIKEIHADDSLDAMEVQDRINAVLDEAQNPLGGLVRELMNRTNTLAAKKSSMDREMEDMVNRKVYSTMTNINNRVTANMVVGSLSSALTNFIPMVQSWHQVSPKFTVQGLRDMIRSTIHDDGTIAKSTFLTNRLIQEENLFKTGWDKLADKAAFMMDAVDNITSQTVWRSKYLQNLSEGMSEAQAIADADQFAKNLMAGRSRGNAPTVFDAKNPFTKMFTAFQLEVANQYGYMFEDVPQDTPDTKRLVKGYATAFLGAYVYNALYSSLVGRDAAFDPISIIEELLKDLFDDDEEEGDAILNLGANILEEVPYVGGLLGGGRIPLSSAIPYSNYTDPIQSILNDVEKAWNEGNFLEGKWTPLVKELLKPLYYLVFPFGGGQMKKLNEGMAMFSDEHPVSGSYTSGGKLRFPVEDNIPNRIQAALFGQYASENARNYFDNNRSAMGENQIQEYMDVDLPIADYWNYRDGLKGLSTNEEKADFINSLDIEPWQKNLLLNNILDRETEVDMTNYGDYSGWDEFDYAQKNPEKYDLLNQLGVSYEAYSTDEATKKAVNWAHEYPENYLVSRLVTDDVVKYRQFATDLDNIRSKDEDGNTISTSVKERKVAYINALDIDYGAKLILFKNEYNADDTYNEEICEYINSRTDISFNEKLSILKKLGFTVSEDGYITWD
jgi:hypothetical protein